MSWLPLRRRRIGSGLAAAVCALLAAVAPPAAYPQQTIAKMEVGKEAIRWHPAVEAGGWQLGVSGPGVDLRLGFGAREQPALPVKSEKSGLLPDGSYRYELQAIPAVDPKVREKLAAARQASDRGEAVDGRRLGLPAPLPAQSGSFAVLEGAFVAPGEREPEPEVRQTGDVEVEGSLKVRGAKSFVAADPHDAGRELVYASLEGPEAGTYLRGTARTRGGEAVIALPAHFGAVTEAEGLTVQLTPTGDWSRLYVAERSPSRLVVRNAGGGDVAFDYLIQGVRRGYSDFRVERGPAGASGRE